MRLIGQNELVKTAVTPVFMGVTAVFFGDVSFVTRRAFLGTFLLSLGVSLCHIIDDDYHYALKLSTMCREVNTMC